MQGSRYKVHNVLDQDHGEYDASVAALWDHAEKFDPKTERLFRYLQVGAQVPSHFRILKGFPRCMHVSCRLSALHCRPFGRCH